MSWCSYLLLTTTVATEEASPFMLRAEARYWAVSMKSQLKMKGTGMRNDHGLI